MLNKQEVYDVLKDELNKKISGIQQQFDELKQALTSETKSTAGDKHETGRAMAQLEQEKLSSQLTQFMTLKDALSKVNPKAKHDTIQYGSLVETSNGYFFFSIGLGKINVNGTDVFCITATSPLGQKLLGKSKGDSIQMNQSVQILDLI